MVGTVITEETQTNDDTLKQQLYLLSSPCFPAGFGRKEVVEYLIHNGARVDTQDDGVWLLLLYSYSPKSSYFDIRALYMHACCLFDFACGCSLFVTLSFGSIQ